MKGLDIISQKTRKHTTTLLYVDIKVNKNLSDYSNRSDAQYLNRANRHITCSML